MTFYKISTAVIILLFLLQAFTSCSGRKASESPVVLQAGYDGGFNGCFFEFKQDSTFQFGNGSAIGVDFVEGTYSIKDSIITIDKAGIDKAIVSPYLLIREQKSLWNPDSIDKYLYQVDSEGNIIKNSIPFIVHIDDRAAHNTQF